MRIDGKNVVFKQILIAILVCFNFETPLRREYDHSKRESISNTIYNSKAGHTSNNAMVAQFISKHKSATKAKKNY